jgi:hypothetical protein
MLKVLIPKYCQNEQCYILDIMLGEFLGLDFELAEHNESNIVISRPGNNACLSLNTEFFQISEHAWLEKESMPILPLENWTPQEYEIQEALVDQSIPVLYGQPGLVKNDNHWHLNLDIFGSTFFMLSRYEELVTMSRDNHDRFPSSASVASKAGFLDRPIVNEYLEILWSCIKTQWADLVRKERKFRKLISCDVDQPFDCTVESLPSFGRALAGDLLKRKSIKDALERVRRYFFNKLGNYKYDKNYTFKWYMDTCEAAGVNVAFYFIPDSSEKTNGCYSLEDKKIQNLIKYIDSRGHEIGVHGSYQTYQDKEKSQSQKKLLDNTLSKLNISQKVIGNRQHYLRWDSALTPFILENSEFEYDTTGSYADMPGFKYGVCYEFSMFDFLNRKKLKIKQKPLIVMECSIIDDAYMGLGHTQETVDIMQALKAKCLKYNGDFLLLWHNSSFHNENDKNIFKKIVNC